MMTPKVAAYITAYEDEASLNRCIECIFKQTYAVEKILVVDNSKEKIGLLSRSEKITVSHYPENIGISGGLSLAIKWAIDENYDFLWTFDQDSQPIVTCLNNLIEEYCRLTSQNSDVGIIAPLSFDSNTGIELPGGIFDRYRFTHSKLARQETYECDVVITSGSLVSIKAAKESKMPELGLFIDAVDWDYCMNLKSAGYGVFMTKKAIMHHRFGDMKFMEIPFCNRKITINNYAPIRRYYICRNHTYLTLKSSSFSFLPVVIAHRLIYLFRSSMTILFFERNKIEKVYLGIVGTFDGFLRRLGKRTENVLR